MLLVIGLVFVLLFRTLFFFSKKRVLDCIHTFRTSKTCWLQYCYRFVLCIVFVLCVFFYCFVFWPVLQYSWRVLTLIRIKMCIPDAAHNKWWKIENTVETIVSIRWATVIYCYCYKWDECSKLLKLCSYMGLRIRDIVWRSIVLAILVMETVLK